MSLRPLQPVPVFPLPGVVLFPRAELPLHVFETRYRQMVRDALAGERFVAMAVLAPGWERDYHGSPPFLGLGCLGRIAHVQWRPDDRYDMVIEGLARVHFGRAVREFPYRACRVEVLEDAPYDETDPFTRLEHEALVDAARPLLAVSGAWVGPPVLDAGWTYVEVVNRLASALRLPAEAKLELLGEDLVLERGRKLREHVRRLAAAMPPGGGAEPEAGRN